MDELRVLAICERLYAVRRALWRGFALAEIADAERLLNFDLPALLTEVEQQRARIAELEAVTAPSRAVSAP